MTLLADVFAPARKGGLDSFRRQSRDLDLLPISDSVGASRRKSGHRVLHDWCRDYRGVAVRAAMKTRGGKAGRSRRRLPWRDDNRRPEGDEGRKLNQARCKSLKRST